MTLLQKRLLILLAVVLVAAAVITPTSDVFTLLLVSFPMWLLYEVGIWVVAATESRSVRT